MYCFISILFFFIHFFFFFLMIRRPPRSTQQPTLFPYTTLFRSGLWDQVMIADLKYFDGNLARIDRVPAALRRLYATAFEVEPKWLVEAGARRQKWIDQSQSLNIYMAGASGKKLDETYKLAWIRGLKTTYYLRAMGATHAEKSTVKAGQLNAVPTESSEEPKFCAVDTPD